MCRGLEGAWVRPIRELVMRDESGEGGGDCQMLLLLLSRFSRV